MAPAAARPRATIRSGGLRPPLVLMHGGPRADHWTTEDEQLGMAGRALPGSDRVWLAEHIMAGSTAERLLTIATA